jgi:hypothetical protein
MQAEFALPSEWKRSRGGVRVLFVHLLLLGTDGTGLI